MCSFLAAIFASCFLVSITRAENHLLAAHGRVIVGNDAAVSLPGSILPSPTSTAATPAPTLVFDQIEQMTTCKSATISWLYRGIPSTLTLIVTNQDVAQSTGVSFRGIKRRQNGLYITRLLSMNADPSIQVFIWPQVSVPQGYYVVEASVMTLSTQSLAFYVTNGTDTSCLLSSTPSTSSPMSTSSTPFLTSPTSSSSTSDVPVSTPGSPALNTANLSTHVNKGAVAGGVVGGLAVVAVVIAAFMFFRCRKSSSRVLRSRGPAGAWGGLDSKTNISGKPRKSGLRAAFGGINANPFHANAAVRTDSIGHHHERSFNTIDEDLVSISPSEEKITTDANGGMITGNRNSTGTLENISPLPYSRDNRRTSASVKHGDNANYSRPRRANSYGNSTADAWAMSRRGPIDDNGGSAEIPMGRSPSCSGSDNMHKTPRKPVPAYDPYETPISPTIYNDHHGGNADGFSSEYKFNSSQQSVAMQNLNHKGSFGDVSPRIHYLIPDLPPSVN